MTAAELVEQYRRKKAAPTAFLQELIKRIERLDPSIHAFNRLESHKALDQARDLEQAGFSEEKILWGVPVLVKDNICVEGVETTCASKILSGFRPPYSATVVERLKAAGAIVLGMANMDEFAFGSSCEYSATGPTRNPWDLNRVPGGSSGGSAAAVAAGLTGIALGSDTGGSIRQPASFCGVVGLKPTYGRVSRYGLIAFASSLDQIGPLTKTVRDSAMTLQAIAGFDPKDSTSGNLPVGDYIGALSKPVKGLKVGVAKEYFIEGLDPVVRKAVDQALEVLKGLGVEVQPVSMPHTEYAVPTYYIVATAEASSNLARFDGVQYGTRSKKSGTLQELYRMTRGEGFGPEAKRRIILGTFVLSSGYTDAYYNRALQVRTLIKRDFDKVFEAVDCLVTPTAPTAAFRLGEKLSDPLTMYLSDIFTISANLAGIPALSLPCGFTADRLPIGLQLMAKPFAEETLFQLGQAYESASPWSREEPGLRS